MSTPPSDDHFDAFTQEQVDSWLTGPYDEETKEKIRLLVRDNPKEIIESFYKQLTFGTGGMRGVMGVGINRMNIYTVQTAIQGFANFLKKQHPEKLITLFIGYDSRQNSKIFANEAAKVLAGHGIKVFLTSDICPTPLVSFGCRFKECDAALMITASHNTSEYNGLKVYGSDGGQILAQSEQAITEEIHKIEDPLEVQIVESLNHPLIVYVEDEVDDAYLTAIQTLPCNPKDNKFKGKELNIVYTSLHGTGITLMPRALRLFGFSNFSFVDEQIVPDPLFSTINLPNPEESETLKLGIQTLINKKADLLIATDPDADRVAIVAMHADAPFIFTGNQIACICLEYICKALRDQKNLPENAAVIKTIVTTELFRVIAKDYQTTCFDTLVGFKYIAELIHEWDLSALHHFIFGGEESLGYLYGTFVRDKDGISTACLIAEIALQAKLKGKTLVDCLYDIYTTYGIYSNHQISLTFEESKEGYEAIKKAIETFRTQTIDEINGNKIVKFDDYLTSKSIDLETKKSSELKFPVSDLLIYTLEEGSRLMIRPSGTERKVKIYCEIVLKNPETIEEGLKLADAKANELLNAIKELLTTQDLV